LLLIIELLGDVMNKVFFALFKNAVIIFLFFLSMMQMQVVRAESIVRVSMLAPSALLWLHAIAEDQGFYKSRSLKIESLVVGSSAALVQSVASGSVEAGIALGDLTIRAIDKGAPIIISGAVLDKTILRLVGGAGIVDAKQLAGANITAGAVEGGTANLLRYQLLKLGINPNDTKMVSLTNSRDRLVALENGQVKGALLIAPFDTLAENQGMKVLDVYKDPYLQTPLILNKEWASKNREVAKNLTSALQAAARWIYIPGNKSKSISILAKYTNTDEKICEGSYKFIVEDQKAIARDLRVSSASLENIIKIDEALGAKQTGQFEVKKYYDPSFQSQ